MCIDKIQSFTHTAGRVHYILNSTSRVYRKLDHSAAESSRRRQPKREGPPPPPKEIGEPPNQPNLLDAAENFSASHGGPNKFALTVGLITRIFSFYTGHLRESGTESLKQAYFTAESAGERILKIGQYLAKLRTREWPIITVFLFDSNRLFAD